MYELIEADNRKITLDDELQNAASILCKLMNFHHWKIIMFSHDKLYGGIRYSSEGDTHWSPNSQGAFFDRAKGNSYLNVILDEKQIVFIEYRPDTCSKYKPISEDALVELYIPLFFTGNTEGEVIGCLYLSKKDYIHDDINTLLAREDVSFLIIEIQSLFDGVYMGYVENRSLFDLVHIFFGITKTREPFLKRHPYNVAFISNLIGQELGLSESELYRLYIAAILHDIGKVYISEATLNKPGPLTKEEEEEMRMHPIYSYNIVNDLTRRFSHLSGIDKNVLHHHERYDGTGYPDGLKGEEIPIESRILAVADSVDAMLSERSYKKPKSIERAISELLANKGKQFDPELAQIMVDILLKKQRNQNIILSTPVTPGTIEILTDKYSCQLQGTLIKGNFGYRFKVDHGECSCKKCKCPLNNILGATFHTEDNGKIYEYHTTIKYKGNDQIYITKMEAKPSSEYFSLMWQLDGVLSFKNCPSSKVTVNKIGGDHLGFFVYEKDITDKRCFRNAHAITINFDDGSAITVTGKITKTVKVGLKIHCDFKYLNIMESTRDKIFRQIFRKQAELRKAIFNYRHA